MLEQIKLSYRSIGGAVVSTIEGKKLSVACTPDEKNLLIQLIVDYNKRNSKERLTKIKRLFNKKSEKEKQDKLVQKKVTKKKVKEIKEEIKKVKAKNEGKIDKSTEKTILGDKRFVIKGGKAYLRPYLEVPMPDKLLEKIVNCITSKVDVQPYINFWELALLNPNAIARTKLFDYLEKHNLLVTPHGYFVTFRMVKKTNKFTTDGREIFTSAKTGLEEYIVGEPFRMPRAECDEDGTIECSRGLHTGSPLFIGIQVGDGYGKKTVTTKTASPASYGTGYDNPKETTQTKTFDQTFGNQAIICLVNPMHVVSIPLSDTRKMRSCELFFVKATTAEEVIDLTEKDYLVYDVQYKEFEKKELEEMLKTVKLEHWVDESKKSSPATLKRLESQKDELLKKLSIGKDNLNTSLSMADINSIIRSRVK